MIPRRRYRFRVGMRIFWPDGQRYGYLTGERGTVTAVARDLLDVTLDNGRQVHLGTTGECVPLRVAIAYERDLFRDVYRERVRWLREIDADGRPTEPRA